MNGFKGFDKDLKCKGHQYEVGKTYEHKGDIKLCETGLHFCENPMDVFNYYAPADSRFAEVEADGVSDEKSGDSKKVCRKIKIKAELNILNLVNLSVKYVLDHVIDTKKESNAGYRSASTNTGNYSASTNTGYRSASKVEGKDSIACGLGYQNKASGKIGCWLVLAERDNYENGYKILSVKTVLVDGKKIKEDIWYTLKGGKFVVVK